MNIQTLLTRRVAEIIDKKHLEPRLRSGKKLRIKFGIDPNRRELHLGHAVPLWKLREFQEAGHKAVFIIGDWTAMIGDPSGKDKTRPSLSRKEVEANAKQFFKQAYLILDKQKTEVHLQSEWFKGFGLEEIIKLASKVTVSKIMSHETFRSRLKKDLPFFTHEIIYPLLQGYDSVAVKADLELGAMDQKFNLLMGRDIQKAFGQAKQDIIMVKYLLGLDGKEKMSKSLNNFIALTDSAEEMFGKIMSIPDQLIEHYFELATEAPEKEIKKIKKEHPREQKIRLAKKIVSIYHGSKGAERAEREFEKKFGRQARRSLGEGGANIKADLTLKKRPGSYPIVDLLVEGRLAASRSEARRKIQEGAVEIDGNKISNPAAKAAIQKRSLIRLGKRFLRIA